MQRTYRYIIYLVIGIFIYYALEADKDPEALNEIHNFAPVAIMLLFVALLIVRYIRTRRGE